MPPLGYRKRQRSLSPASSPPTKKKAPPTPRRGKPSLFETADAPPNADGSKLEENKKFLDGLDDDEDESSLSDADSDEFEDVPPSKRQKTSHARDSKDDTDEEEDEMDWEDAIPRNPGSSSHATPSAPKAEPVIADVSISVNEDGSYVEPLVSAATGKKGPSKLERQVRVQSHCLHVQALMWHNTVRNSWLNDKDVQKTLVDGLTDGVKKEVKRWNEKMQQRDGGKTTEKPEKGKGKVKRGSKGKGKSSGGRDWTEASQQLEPGSGIDPLLRLLKVLTAYWRKRFSTTAPGLRKQGYKPLRRLRDEMKAWGKNPKDIEENGERIESLKDFRRLARKCEGSRDVGAQLFVALLRGLGLETRMVANLQPVGFGWSKGEEADERKRKKEDGMIEQVGVESESDNEVKVDPAPATEQTSAKKGKTALKKEKPSRRSSRGNKTDPIDLDDSESPLSSAPSEVEDIAEIDDDDEDISVVDITPNLQKKKPTKKYDRDMAFPNYWVEVCSTSSHNFYPVDPIVLSTIASNEELLATFEPRGKRAEKAKQVMAYTIAFSADSTAKDVTVRYIKRHQLPGKTKGMRMPVEKVPVYNRRGKVKKYEDYDWFRTLMSVYDRPENKRTAADDLEEATDLKPFKPANEAKEVAKESLQGYKQSADYVLEQHLRREEALLPGSEPVKTFTAGKGDKATEHPVYRRDDIVVCKTVESWHKEGRAVNIGEQPLKYVPMRAVTLIRKREIEDAQRETGEKMKQGLYSQDQTDWIIPPPIENGVIPKNAFGNMDVYVPTMVPKGAVHLPLKGSAKLCKKLSIDFAEACTGFEFGKQRAVPVLTGVVVAKEHAGMVRGAWRAEQKEVQRKADTKRTTTALHRWRKMLLGLRVLERMRTEYADAGGKEEEVNPFVLRAKREGRDSGGNGPVDTEGRSEGGGGFLPPDYDEEEASQRNGLAEDDEDMQNPNQNGAGGFLIEDEESGGGFLVEEDVEINAARAPPKNHAPITPVSLQSIVKGSAVESDNAEEIDAKQPSTSTKRKAKTATSKAKPKQTNARDKNTRPKTKRKSAVPVESESEDSTLSTLSESADDISDDGTESKPAPTPPTTTKKSKRVSPQVVVSPRKGKRSNRAAPVKKETAVRSQYFDHGDTSNHDGESAGESEEEVVKPRGTTSRTKGGR